MVVQLCTTENYLGFQDMIILRSTWYTIGQYHTWYTIGHGIPWYYLVYHGNTIMAYHGPFVLWHTRTK